MNFLLYVVLFIIFSPKFFMVLGGRRVASVSMTDILFHALLFALGLYVAGYLTRTYHVFEGFTGTSGTCPLPDNELRGFSMQKGLKELKLTSKEARACNNRKKELEKEFKKKRKSNN